LYYKGNCLEIKKTVQGEMFIFDKTSYNNLMARWEKARPAYSYFIHDGIINEEAYCKSAPRILFLLKESNDDYTEIALEKGSVNPADGNSTLFWRKLNIMQYILQQTWNGISVNKDDIENCKNKLLKGIAYINIKKNAENKSVSDISDLFIYAENDAEFLQEQITLLSPQIIVCCGTKALYNKIYPENCSFLVYGVSHTKEYLVIDSYHPSYYGESFENLFQWLSNSMTAQIVQNEILLLKHDN
jgi:hypothetical protein